MKVLGIETSTMTGSVALIDGESLLAKYTLDVTQKSKERKSEFSVSSRHATHTSKLMPAIDRMLQEASLAIKDIKGIAVSSGPGSFTGLRIGVATAKGLAQGLNIPVVGIPTLDGLAFNLSHSKDLLCPMLDARKGEIYCALYRNGKRLSRYMACEPSKLLKRIRGKVIFLGDGIEIYKSLLKRSLGRRAVFASDGRRSPTALSIAKLGLRKLERNKRGELLTLKPIYIRLSGAEITFKECQKRRKGQKGL